MKFIVSSRASKHRSLMVVQGQMAPGCMNVGIGTAMTEFSGIPAYTPLLENLSSEQFIAGCGIAMSRNFEVP